LAFQEVIFDLWINAKSLPFKAKNTGLLLILPSILKNGRMMSCVTYLKTQS